MQITHKQINEFVHNIVDLSNKGQQINLLWNQDYVKQKQAKIKKKKRHYLKIGWGLVGLGFAITLCIDSYSLIKANSGWQFRYIFPILLLSCGFYALFGIWYWFPVLDITYSKIADLSNIIIVPSRVYQINIIGEKLPVLYATRDFYFNLPNSVEVINYQLRFVTMVNQLDNAVEIVKSTKLLQQLAVLQDINKQIQNGTKKPSNYDDLIESIKKQTVLVRTELFSKIVKPYASKLIVQALNSTNKQTKSLLPSDIQNERNVNLIKEVL